MFSLSLAAQVGAQESLQREREFVDSSGGGMWMTMGLVFVVGLGLAAYFWRKSKKGANKVEYNYQNRYANYYTEQAYDSDEGVDAEKELEWLRKAKKQSSTKNGSPKLGFGLKKPGTKPAEGSRASDPDGASLDTRVFQEKMRRLQYSQLPINSFSQLAPAKGYTPLPLSEDLALLSAIEQASEEFEEDEAVRELGLRVLAAFRNRNAVDAVTQIALYDLSANLRAKAVNALTEYDHESVFEPILLACADPTREVRAAAARGLFRLNFDRAHAWKRLIEANDEFRFTQAARAATESGIVSKSFERLIHEDTKVAYEAFALVSLLIKAGETKEIFTMIEDHKDERVRFALLHVIRVQKDERTLDELNRLALKMTRRPDMLEKIKETIAGVQSGVQTEAWQTS
ncbi:MAG TPA: HEAT repeat domain-containing protein [Pyrinomonadaceae bacterium]|nr:HEAT repeat domain-containing protein [Pyrinomonadaceae bacterium]